MWEMLVDYFLLAVEGDTGTQTIKVDKMKRYRNTKHAQVKKFITLPEHSTVLLLRGLETFQPIDEIVTLIDSSVADFPHVGWTTREIIKVLRHSIFVPSYLRLLSI